MLTRRGRAVLEQLRLEDGLDEELAWGGRSPRELTKAHRRFILGESAAPLEEWDEQVVEEQHRRFRHGF